MIILKEVETRDTVKCVCPDCQGKGLVKPEKSDNRIVRYLCPYCIGKGYEEIEFNDEKKLYKDEQTNNFYIVINGVVSEKVTLFNELEKTENIKYVFYDIGYDFRDKWYEENAHHPGILSYEEFLKGLLPMPLEQYTCPRIMYRVLSVKKNFTKECDWAYMNHRGCSKFSPECWPTFYEGAVTQEEKQKVLQKLRG